MARPRNRVLAETEGQAPSLDYEVGYGRPPTEKRFVAGKSGNPKGRPAKRKKPEPTLEEILSETIIVTGSDGRPQTLTKKEVVNRQLVAKAMKGDHRSIMAVREHDRRRAEGESEPDLFESDPNLGRSILEQYEKEVLERDSQRRKTSG